VLLCAAAVVVLVLAAVVGVMVQGSVSARAAQEAAARVRVPATVSVVVGPTAPADPSGPGGRRVLASWTAPDGTPRSGEVTAPVAAMPGATVPVWVDRTGTELRPPVSAWAAPLVGGVVGVGLATFCGLLLYLAWRFLRRMTARHNAETWARGWAEVEPTWSGRATTT